MSTTWMAEADFMAAIAENPDEDLPRLVLADWWEEKGNAQPSDQCSECKGVGRVKAKRTAKLWGGTKTLTEATTEACSHCGGAGVLLNPLIARAEFVRVQCELVNRVDLGTRSERLLARQRDLFTRYAGVWWPWERAYLTPPEMTRGPNGEMFVVSREPVSDGRSAFPFLLVRRGLPDEWHGTLGAWCGEVCNLHWGPPLPPHCPGCKGTGRTPGVGPAVVKAHPYLRTVRAADREPFRYIDDPRKFGWSRDRPTYNGAPQNALPPEVWDLLPSGKENVYDSPADAHAALSDALLAWAKK